jgi:putative ABC transport system substrate-binding protein
MAKLPRVGFLSGGTPASVARNWAAFLDGLRELGYVEGSNLNIEGRYAEDRVERLPSLAAELVTLPVDVIVTDAAAPATAAKEATGTIPVVMAAIGDPIGAGLAASLARPGGNLTGFVLTSPGLSGKRLELFKQAIPTLSLVAALWDSASPTSSLSDSEAAARFLSVELRVLAVRTPNELTGAFEAARDAHADGLVSLGGGMLINARRQIVEFAAGHRLPGMFPQREYADDGGLLAYGPNVGANYRRAATYVDKILKGANPADLPIEQPTTFDFVINLKAAQTLGLVLPPSILAQATEILP